MPAPHAEFQPRSRSRAEAAFAIMRTLLKGRLLWPYDGALPLEALEALVDAPLTVLTSALAHLSDEGVVLVDKSAGTVQLSGELLNELSRVPRVLH
jgi:hypothetical protein